MKRIGVLLGSSRCNGNSKGMEAWLLHRLQDRGFTEEQGFEIVHLYPHNPVHPLGSLVEDIVPAMVTDAEGYPDPKIQAWSRLVSSCHAFIFLTPQYNWGYPGDLKNAIDHLYHEWLRKPFVLITYGGHGGSKCAEQLKLVLAGGLKMKEVAEPVQITLPGDFIRSSSRVSAEDVPVFLSEKQGEVVAAIDQLKVVLSSSE